MVLGAARRAAAHVDSYAVQRQGPLPQTLDEPKHLPFGFGDGDVAELFAGAGHGVSQQRIGVRAESLRGGGRGGGVFETGGNVGHDQTLLMRHPQRRGAPALGEPRHAFQLRPRQPAQRRAQAHGPAVGSFLRKPADQFVVAGRRRRLARARRERIREMVFQPAQHAVNADPLDQVTQPRLLALSREPWSRNRSNSARVTSTT